jgi:hypothetical protein
MHHLLGALIVGGIAGGATSNRARLRRTLRGIVKQGIIAKHKVQVAGAALADEAQKIVSEARMELDQAGKEPRS